MVNIGSNWKCPYCGHAQVLDKRRVAQEMRPQLADGWKEKGWFPIIFTSSVVCANDNCRECVERDRL